MMRLLSVISLAIFSQLSFSQNLVDITFRHFPTNDRVVRAFVPGTFNNWGPNNNGVINPGASSEMTFNETLGCYIKKITLGSGVTYHYKFHEHYNQSGSDWSWLTDPLNPNINYSDNNNSILKVSDAMIFELYPKNGSTISSANPKISAGIFIVGNDTVDLTESKIYLNNEFYSTFENYYFPDFSVIQFDPSDLPTGTNSVKLSLKTTSGKTAADSTTFFYQTKNVFFQTPDCDSLLAAEKNIRWQIKTDPTAISKLELIYPDMSQTEIPVETDGEYEQTVKLKYGENRFIISLDEDGIIFSDTLNLSFPEPEKPTVKIEFEKVDNNILLKAIASDLQGDPLIFSWSNQPLNPETLPVIDGSNQTEISIPIPQTPGDYSFKLTAKDSKGNESLTINFFTVNSDRSITIPNLETIPNWVSNARTYCLFFKGFTQEGTINAAVSMLDHIKNMGFSAIWVLPVTDVEGTINQSTNIGYNIVDFYNVEPFYGSNDDFKHFVKEAHDRGLRVILDVTPNHSSRSHALALDVRAHKKFSRYYDFYQHEIINHNTNGLGQSISSDGIVYYSGFSDMLLNWNWSDAEARQYMLDVYKHWLAEYDIDGFRFDVYWGPHRKYGLENFDIPLRKQLRAVKADIMLLGETNGTGSGSEEHYADAGGGIDMGYDWSLKDAIWNYPAATTLNTRLYNGGYRPGPNSLYLRFLENQDEDRVAYRYNSIEKTMPVSAAIFTSTGTPLMYQGQEVGMGYQMSGSKDDRARATVEWDKEYAKTLAPHYQKLAQIRKQFPAFRRQFADTNGDGDINSQDQNVQARISYSDYKIYAFARPYLDENGLVVINFSGETKQIKLPLDLADWAEFSTDQTAGTTYFMSDLYTGTTADLVHFGDDTLTTTLPPYGVKIYIISDEEKRLELPDIEVSVIDKWLNREPESLTLVQNYPNPFNPTTTIDYEIPVDSMVKIDIFDIQGRLLKSLSNSYKTAGKHSQQWDGLDESGNKVASGIYVYRIVSGNFVETKKMTLIK